MRIRIIKKFDATYVTVSDASGTMNVQESVAQLVPGQFLSGKPMEIVPTSEDTVDIHLKNGDVITNVPKDAIEEHGDGPAPTRFSRNCCKEK